MTQMEGDVARLFACGVAPGHKACIVLACFRCRVTDRSLIWRWLVSPFLLPTWPALTYMKVLLTGATGAGQSLPIAIHTRSTLEQLTNTSMAQRAWESCALFSSITALAMSLTSAVVPSPHGSSSLVVLQPTTPHLRIPSFPRSSIRTF